MTERRSFLSYMVGMLASIPVLAQQHAAVIEKGEAVVCQNSGSTLKCPLGHETCRSINAPLAIGNDSHDYPEVSQLFNYRVHRCDVCGVLFCP